MIRRAACGERVLYDASPQFPVRWNHAMRGRSGWRVCSLANSFLVPAPRHVWSLDKLVTEPTNHKKYDVEHALKMHTSSYINLPAALLYDKEVVATIKEQAGTFHIYFIGQMPKITLMDAREISRKMVITVELCGEKHEIGWNIPEGLSLVGDIDNGYHLTDGCGSKLVPSPEAIFKRLNSERAVNNTGHSVSMRACLAIAGSCNGK